MNADDAAPDSSTSNPPDDGANAPTNLFPSSLAAGRADLADRADQAILAEGAGELRLLSRSPHPYHHKNADLLHAADRIAPLSPTRTLRPRARPQPADPAPRPGADPRPHAQSRPTPANAASATTFTTSITSSTSAVSLASVASAASGFFGKDSTPASDSGTEADDEHFLKGLPAPRPKPHKGLRGMNEVLSGISTPLLSPVSPRSGGEASAGGRTTGDGRRRRGRRQDGNGADTDGGESIAGSSGLVEDDEDGADAQDKNVGGAWCTGNVGDMGRQRRHSGTAISPQRLFQKLRRDVAILDSRDKDRRQGRGSAERSRRRREVVRRSTELLLLVSLAALLFSNPDARPLLFHWRRELQAVTAVVGGLLVLYPARIVLWTRREQRRQQSVHSDPDRQPPPPLRLSIGLPAAFDPAPILYPLAIPVLVSFLLATPTLHAAPLLNLILSICTLPRPLVPLALSGELYAPVQWTLSCVPMMVAEQYPSAFKSRARGGLLSAASTTLLSSPPPPPFADLSPETVTLLYPLHQTLCWLLHDLTTTSLLPAELQLLSVALVNLLVLAASPQAVILQALLWGGGLGILIMGGMVIRWGITLARVPRWRFRREGDVASASSSSPVSSLSAVLRRLWAAAKSPRRARLEMMFGSGDRKAGDWDSDDSMNDHAGFLSQSDSAGGGGAQPKKRLKLKPAGRQQQEFQMIAKSATAPIDGQEPVEGLPRDDEPPVPSIASNADGVHEFPRFTADEAFASWAPAEHHHQSQPGAAANDSSLSRPARAASFSAAALSRTAKAHAHAHMYTTTPSGRRKRAASSTVRAFFSLTHAQAARRKWLYAAYLYACIALLALAAIRRYVGAYALRGHEPVGWALGYLLGDVGWFRLEVVKANLEYWVCLPPRTAGPFSLFSSWSSTADAADAAAACRHCQAGWVEHVRQAWLGAAATRLALAAYWLAVLVVGLAVVLTLSPVYEVDTRRKVFHFMMVAMLLPATFVDPAYAALALAVVLAVFLLLDLLRASQLPPLSRPIAAFLTPYVDGRDLRGPVVISHIFLLIGCAIPLWLSLAALPRGPVGAAAVPAPAAAADSASTPTSSDCTAGWEVPTRDVSMVSGIICVGLGDAAASLIGRRWGRRKWLWGGGKSLEGSVAFATAVFAGLMAASLWLRVGGWPATGDPVDASSSSLAAGPTLHRAWAWIGGRAAQAAAPRAGVCATVASLTEAVLTGGNDNVVVPVILWTCVRSFGL